MNISLKKNGISTLFSFRGQLLNFIRNYSKDLKMVEHSAMEGQYWFNTCIRGKIIIKDNVAKLEVGMNWREITRWKSDDK